MVSARVAKRATIGNDSASWRLNNHVV